MRFVGGFIFLAGMFFMLYNVLKTIVEPSENEAAESQLVGA
jgi:cbb3-type cytochrome oxidase subunit 1